MYVSLHPTPVLIYTILKYYTPSVTLLPSNGCSLHPKVYADHPCFDFQQQIKNYITNDLKLLNSYDTWHGQYHLSYFIIDTDNKTVFYAGTKNVAKALLKVLRGKGDKSVRPSSWTKVNRPVSFCVCCH